MAKTSQSHTDNNEPDYTLIFEKRIVPRSQEHHDRDLPFSRCASYVAEDEELAAMSSVTGHITPTDVLIHREYPGLKQLDLNGPSADEAVGLLLAEELRSAEALQRFSSLLAQPTIASKIVGTLLPRAQNATKRGLYLMSEDQVSEVTTDVLNGLGETRPNVIRAFTYVMTRTFSVLKLMLPSESQRTVRAASTWVLNKEDMAKLVLIDAMRDLFSDQRLAGITKELSQDAVPAVIATIISRNLRSISQQIPEILLRINQLNIVNAVVNTYIMKPQSLPEQIQAYPSLQTLADYANFFVQADPTDLGVPTMANADIKDALDNVLRVLNSATNIEVLPLATYKKYFGFVPASIASMYKGGVLYMMPGQQSKMPIYEVLEERGGTTLRYQPLEYAPISKVSDEVNRVLLAPGSIRGLANMVADELASAPFVVGQKPKLYTIGATEIDIKLLALAMANTVSFGLMAGDMDMGPALPSPIYGVTIAEQWLMHVTATSGNEAFFSAPPTVVLYAFGAQAALSMSMEVEPIPLPSKVQIIEIPVFTPIKFLTGVKPLINQNVGKEFTTTLPTKVVLADDGSGKPTTAVLKMKLEPLHILLPDGVAVNQANDVFYATIAENGVDAYAQLMFFIALSYTQSPDKVMADKAKSWLVETLGEMMKSPVNVNAAMRSLNRAIIASKADIRLLRSQYQDLVAGALFATVLATLARFEKISDKDVGPLMAALPASTLTVKATTVLMSASRAILGSAPNLNTSRML